MATSSKTTAHSDAVLSLIRGTTITAPSTVDIALHTATTLSAGVAAGVTAVSLPISPIVGTDIKINVGGASEETRTVTSVTGSGPYTVNFSGGLANPHVAGEPVMYDPGEDLAKLAEPSGNGYARKSVTANTTNWGAPAAHTSGRKIQNAVAQDFATPTGDWWWVTHAVIFNGSTGWYYGALATPKRVQAPDTFSIPVNGWTVSED